VVLSVQDTGPGMDPEVQSRIFEPFFTTKPPGRGSGLGLAIVHGIVREHGGALEVESAPGKGTTLRVILPAADLNGSDEPVEAPVELKGAGERILYVDDEPGLGELGKRRLELLGYKVTVASDGEDALSIFEAAPDDFDAVVTDYLMPKSNGLELASAVALIRPDLPVIILTGYIDDLPEETIRASGVRKLVRKPITTREIGVALAHVRGRQVEG
jgi:CheY-like chemotaxis protein